MANIDNIWWEPLPEALRDGDRITCKVDGMVVSGKVNLSPKVVEVEMDFPGAGGCAGEILEMIAPVIYTEEPFDGSSANLLGLYTARELLLSLFFGKKALNT